MSDAGWRIRPGTTADVPFLRAMLYEAAFWDPAAPRPSIDAGLADPHLGLYIDGWGRDGDLAVIALDTMGQPAGAAWLRRFSPDEPGYGFIDTEIPELSIGVHAEHRGAGAGTALMSALMHAAGANGIVAVSLSVDPANPARRLYERLGFSHIGENAARGRCGACSLTRYQP